LLVSSALNEAEAALDVVVEGLLGEVADFGAVGDVVEVSAAIAANGSASAPANAMMLMRLLSMGFSFLR
jgi:hypothetical protein